MTSEPRRGLGRGLSALLGEEERAPQPGGGVKTVAIEKLHPGRFQPRRHFDEAALDALAQSIAAQGVLQPLLVRQHPSLAGEFEILAGERRWRAAQRAQLHELPVILREVSDRDALEFALVENVQREDRARSRRPRAISVSSPISPTPRMCWRSASARAAAMSPTRCVFSPCRTR